jgi:large subunit ribosomal protein L35Ae
MQGTISNFRKSVHTQKGNQIIIVVDKVDSKEKAQSLVGKKVVFKTPSGKELIGKISATHGNKGAVRALFETGMPGQSIGQKVNIE